MSRSASPYLYAFIAAALLGLIGLGIVYDSRSHQPDQRFEIVQLPPVPPSLTGTGKTPEETTRQPAVAGDFYSSDPEELKLVVDGFISSADIGQPAGRPRLIVTPHAGHRFSGAVAGHAFRALQGTGYTRAILIGRSHHQQFSGVAADSHDYWQVPLGQVQVDKSFIKRLVDDSGGLVKIDDQPHQDEHSLEVNLPFLVQALGPDVVIVPLLFGGESQSEAAALARSLRRLIDDQTVIVVSTDLSHYPNYRDAAIVDARAIEAMLTGDPQAWRQTVVELEGWETPGLETAACGQVAVESGLDLVKYFGWQGRLLKYANSGQVDPEQMDKSVGYAALVFEGDLPQATGEELDAAEQTVALELARRAINGLFGPGQAESPSLAGLPDVFDEKRGVFVTLNQAGQLRGCIGTVEPDAPLDRSLRSMAAAAASKDSRFQPVQAGELPGLDLEISILSPKVKVNGPDQIELGKHGVWLEQGSASGVFLPQVADQTGWTKERFLSELCSQKAGLPGDCWQDPNTTLYVFTAQVFSEPLVKPADVTSVESTAPVEPDATAPVDLPSSEPAPAEGRP